jgi:hypothetical protein
MIVIKFGGHAMTDTSGSFAEVIKRSLAKEACVVEYTVAAHRSMPLLKLINLIPPLLAAFA